MPTVLRLGPYRFFFYSLEGHEPAQIHVESADKVAKYWLHPVSLASSIGFRSHELTRLRMLVIEKKLIFEEAWHVHFGDRS